MIELITKCAKKKLVSSEDVTSVDLILDVIEAGVVAVSDDGVAAGFEGGEVVDDETAEEGGAVLEGGLVDDDLCSFGFDALHYALDGTLAEVVGVRLHR